MTENTEKTEKREMSEKAEQRRNKKLLTEKRIALFLAIVLVLLSVIAVVRNSNVLDDMKNNVAGWFKSDEKSDNKDSSKDPQENEDDGKDDSSDVTNDRDDNKTSSSVDKKARTFTAVAGDSFTGFARTAIAEYAKAEKLEMTDAQKLTAEVYLVNASGAPLLEIGQKVTIEPTQISAALEQSGVVATTSTSTSKDETKPSKTDFTAKAVAGDSYIVIARQAIAKADGGLSAAQSVAAETFLAEAAGWPSLEIGQAVTIKYADMAQAVKLAKALTVSETAAWQYWASLAGL